MLLYLHTSEQVVALVAELGKDEDSVVNFEEFLHLMAAKMATRDSKEEIFKVSTTGIADL